MTNDADLKSEIVAAVEQNWADKEAPTVLAMLGGKISEKSKAELRVNNQPLAKYIRLHLSDQVRLLTVKTGTDIVAPVSKTAQLNDTDLEDLYLRGRSLNRVSRTSIRFHPAIWAAFIHPLEGGRRFVEIPENGALRTHNVAAQDAAHDLWFEVLATDLPPFDPDTGRASWAAVATSVRAWAERNGLEMEKLQSAEPAREEKGGKSPINSENSAPIVALAAALSVLSKDQLERLLLPADIIVALAGVKR